MDSHREALLREQLDDMTAVAVDLALLASDLTRPWIRLMSAVLGILSIQSLRRPETVTKEDVIRASSSRFSREELKIGIEKAIQIGLIKTFLDPENLALSNRGNIAVALLLCMS